MFSILFRFIERFICKFKQNIIISAILRYFDRSDRNAERNPEFFSHKPIRFCKKIPIKPCRERTHRPFIRHIPYKGCKLISTDTADNISASKTPSYHIGKCQKNPVAHIVPKNVVNKLEIVQVQYHKHAAGHLATILKFPFPAGLVQKTRKSVRCRLFHKAFYSSVVLNRVIDPPYEDILIKRLMDKIRCPELQTFMLGLSVLIACQKNYRYLISFILFLKYSKPAVCLKTVHFRHDHVQKNDIRLAFLYEPKEFPARSKTCNAGFLTCKYAPYMREV